MHKITLRLFVTVALFATGFASVRAAAAIAPAPPSSTASAALKPSFVREAAIVCGSNGCNPVHTKAEKKRKFQTLGHG